MHCSFENNTLPLELSAGVYKFASAMPNYTTSITASIPIITATSSPPLEIKIRNIMESLSSLVFLSHSNSGEWKTFHRKSMYRTMKSNIFIRKDEIFLKEDSLKAPRASLFCIQIGKLKFNSIIRGEENIHLYSSHSNSVTCEDEESDGCEMCESFLSFPRSQKINYKTLIIRTNIIQFCQFCIRMGNNGNIRHQHDLQCKRQRINQQSHSLP